MAANKIVLQVDFQTGGAQAAIDEINKKIAAMGPVTTKASTEATTGIKTVTVSLETATDAVTKMGRAFAGLGIGRALQDLLKTGDELNRIFGAMRTSGQAEFIDMIERLANRQKLDVTDVAQAMNAWRNLGLSAHQAAINIEAESDVLVKHGKPLTNLIVLNDQLTQAYARQMLTIKSQGALFQSSGFDFLTKFLGPGETVKEGRKELTQGSGQAVINTLLLEMSKDAYGAAAANKSLEAQTNLLNNSWKNLGATAAQVLGPSLARLLTLLGDLIELFAPIFRAFERLPGPVKDVTVAIVGLAGAIVTLSAALGALSLIGGTSGLARVGAFITGLGAAGGGMITLGLGEAAAGAGVGAAGGGVVAGLAAIGPGGWAALAALAVAAVFAYLMNKRPDAGPSEGHRATAGEVATARAGIAQVNVEEQQKQIQHAQDILDQARSRNLKAGKESIAALSASYDELFRHAAGNEVALATLRKALAVDVNTEIKKMHEESVREQQKDALEFRRAQRQSVVAAFEGLNDDTIAYKEQLAAVRAQAFEQEKRDDQMARAQVIKDRADAQIAAARKLGIDTTQIAKDANDKIAADNKTTTQEIERYKLDAIKATNEAEIADAKKTADEIMEDQLLRINALRDLRLTHAQLVEPQTYEQRLSQIQRVAAIEQQAIRDTERARLDALAHVKQAYEDSPAGMATDPGAAARQAEKQAEFERQRVNIAFEADAEIQKTRYELWKRTNDAIIEEQKRVFSSFKDFAGQIFDAALDRSKSFFASLGDILKRTVLGATKEFVTNRVAAGLSDVFGYGRPKFSGRFPGGEDVLFGGSGAPPPGPGGINASNTIFQVAGNTLLSAGNALILAAGALTQAASALAVGGGGGGSIGGADRMMDEGLPDYVNPTFTPGQLPGVFGGAATPPFIPPSQGGAGGALSRLGGIFGATGGGSPTQRLRSILTSKGVGSLAAMIGTGLYSGGLQSGSAARTIGGGALAGAGLAQAAGMNPIGGAIAGAGVGLFSAGVQRGGVSGLGMDVAGGILAGGEIGAMFGPTGLLIGAAVGAGVGLIAGVVGLFKTSKDQQVRDLVRQFYGIDIRDKSVRDQIVQIAQSNFGGDIRLAVSSPAVMELVRLYAQAYGASAALPRPMYSATFQQSNVGGLQLQQVYAGGQVVANPYSGTTTTQFQNAMSPQPPLYLQLNPQQAVQLFQGQVVQAIGNNPGAVANANTVAATQGSSRTTQAGALLEPLTVMR